MSGRFSIDALRYVHAVMDEASFSGAARSLRVSQPTLSTAVARLEEQLGHRLFDRSPTGVTPTEFAEEVRRWIDAVLDNVDGLCAASRRWGRSDRATIRLGVSPLIDATLVAGVHRELHARLPDPRDVVLSEGDLDDLVAGLGAGGFDAVLVPSVRQLAGFERRIVGSEPVVVVEQDPEETGPVAVSDLADRPLILVPETCGLTRFTRDLFAEHGLPLTQYPGEAASYRVLEDWADLGLGVSVLPRSRLRAAESPHRLLHDGHSEVEIFYEMVWSPSSPIAEVLRQTAWSVLHPDGAA